MFMKLLRFDLSCDMQTMVYKFNLICLSNPTWRCSHNLIVFFFLNWTYCHIFITLLNDSYLQNNMIHALHHILVSNESFVSWNICIKNSFIFISTLTTCLLYYATFFKLMHLISWFYVKQNLTLTTHIWLTE